MTVPVDEGDEGDDESQGKRKVDRTATICQRFPNQSTDESIPKCSSEKAIRRV
jgi:hypothetical protein